MSTVLRAEIFTCANTTPRKASRQAARALGALRAGAGCFSRSARASRKQMMRADHHADQHVDEADADSRAHVLQLRRRARAASRRSRRAAFGVGRHVVGDPRRQRSRELAEDVGHAREQRGRARAFAAQERGEAEARGDQHADHERCATRPTLNMRAPRARRPSGTAGAARWRAPARAPASPRGARRSGRGRGRATGRRASRRWRCCVPVVR